MAFIDKKNARCQGESLGMVPKIENGRHSDE